MARNQFKNNKIKPHNKEHGNNKLTSEIQAKLEQAFSIDSTVEEACFYAGIVKDTYYRWIKEDKKLSDRLEGMRNRPVLKARKTIFDSLDDPKNAQWYLERKRKKEFAQRQELTGDEGKPIVFLPSEMMEKYGINSSTEDNK